jgi:myo-inositol-1(or 4)-monophosphatase
MDGMSSLDWSSILESIASKVRIQVTRDLNNPGADSVVGYNPSGDLTRRIDIETEKTILEEFEKLRIPLFYIGEEISSKIGENPSLFVVTDCVDGSLNAITGIPFFCTSLAVSSSERMSDVFVGLVMDLCRGDVFTAVKNKGASLNGKPIRVSEISELSNSVLRLSFSYLDEISARNLFNIISKAKHDRHLGSAALELCYLASGYYQSFVDLRKRLRPTDLAAAHLIIKESGGILTSPDGSKLDYVLDPKSRLSIIASCNETLHQEILSNLNPV